MATQSKSAQTINQTDLGNARRLVKLFGSKIRYCVDWAQWLIWNGTTWQPDTTGEIERLAKTTADRIYGELLRVKSEETRKSLASWATKSESKRAIKDMIGLARSEPGIPITPAELDVNPYQLNCLNGTVDLHTGVLHPHRREDFITKLAPVEYDQKARDEIWGKVLSDATDGSVELQQLMQRAFGYSTTGDTGEEVLFLIHGPAATRRKWLFEKGNRNDLSSR